MKPVFDFFKKPKNQPEPNIVVNIEEPEEKPEEMELEAKVFKESPEGDLVVIEVDKPKEAEEKEDEKAGPSETKKEKVCLMLDS